MDPAPKTNRLSLTCENGTIEEFEISGAYNLFKEQDLSWLTIQAETLKPIRLSEAAEYCRLSPGVELNIPLASPIGQLMEGMEFTAEKYDDHLGNLTNLYVGSHIDCPGQVRVQKVLPDNSAHLLFEGHSRDWNNYLGESSMVVRFLLAAQHENITRSFD